MDYNVVYLNIIIVTSKVNYGCEIDDSSEWNNSLEMSIASNQVSTVLRRNLFPGNTLCPGVI